MGLPTRINALLPANMFKFEVKVPAHAAHCKTNVRARNSRKDESLPYTIQIIYDNGAVSLLACCMCGSVGVFATVEIC